MARVDMGWAQFLGKILHLQYFVISFVFNTFLASFYERCLSRPFVFNMFWASFF